MRDAFSGIPIRSVMQTNFTALSTSNVLGDAVKATLDGATRVPGDSGDTVMGILTKANLLAGLSEHGPELPVTNAMTREFPMVESTEMLAAALSRLAESKLHTMPVIEDGKMVGLVTLENLGQYLMIQNAPAPAADSTRDPDGSERIAVCNTICAQKRAPD